LSVMDVAGFITQWRIWWWRL